MFKTVDGGINFRTVSWVKATFIFLKLIFATGVLSIPSSMVTLGAVAGSLLILAFGFINTYQAMVLGRFRNTHAGCHTVADMASECDVSGDRRALTVTRLCWRALVQGSYRCSVPRCLCL